MHVELVAGYRQMLYSDDIRQAGWAGPNISYILPLSLGEIFRMIAICCKGWGRIGPKLRRICLGGRESLLQRLKALGHLFVSAKLADIIVRQRIDHIHANQGYFASHVAMMASQLANKSYSLTLHGSDLLCDRIFLDQKLEHCHFCFTISEYNKRSILQNFSFVDQTKVFVSRLGVREHCDDKEFALRRFRRSNPTVLLTVGRLAPVKDYTFLINACARLSSLGHRFLCIIVGGGPQEKELKQLIAVHKLEGSIKLVGYVVHENLDPWYRLSDVFVLTSKSEGLPLSVMEAMSQGVPVLAPDITGISELVVQEKTGCLYKSGDLADFVAKLEGMIGSSDHTRDLAENGARLVREKYDLYRNSDEFAQRMLSMISEPHGDCVCGPEHSR